MSDKLQALQAQLEAVKAEEAKERQKQAQAEQEQQSAERPAKQAAEQEELDASYFKDININVDKILAVVGKSIKNPTAPIDVNYLMATNPDPRTAIIKIESYFQHANKQATKEAK